MRCISTPSARLSDVTTRSWPADSLPLALHRLPRALGLPTRRPLSADTVALIRAAHTRWLDLGHPAAMITFVDHHAVAPIVGTSSARPRIPLDDIAPHADPCAIFVATLGPGVDRAIRETFDTDPALAFVLDAVASLAAEAMRLIVAAEVLARRRAGIRDAVARIALPYSPGHCGLPLATQRRVFDLLEPASDIGVTLTDVGLMQPTKSVSGMVLVAPRAVHDVGIDYDCCATCTGRHCRAALAAAPSTESRWVPPPVP